MDSSQFSSLVEMEFFSLLSIGRNMRTRLQCFNEFNPFLQCDLRDPCEEILPCTFSWIRLFQRCMRTLSCCYPALVLQSIVACIGTSKFLRTFSNSSCTKCSSGE